MSRIKAFWNNGYRYGFNGMERDDEWNGVGNMYDYGFRIYDPRIAKFLSIDPLFKSYPWLTPFQFSSNNPILFVDLDGLEVYFPEPNGSKQGIEVKIKIVSKKYIFFHYQPTKLYCRT